MQSPYAEPLPVRVISQSCHVLVFRELFFDMYMSYRWRSVLIYYRRIRDIITTGITLVLVIYTHVGAECGKEGGNAPYIRRGAD